MYMRSQGWPANPKFNNTVARGDGQIDPSNCACYAGMIQAVKRWLSRWRSHSVRVNGQNMIMGAEKG